MGNHQNVQERGQNGQLPVLSGELSAEKSSCFAEIPPSAELTDTTVGLQSQASSVIGETAADSGSRRREAKFLFLCLPSVPSLIKTQHLVTNLFL